MSFLSRNFSTFFVAIALTLLTATQQVFAVDGQIAVPTATPTVTSTPTNTATSTSTVPPTNTVTVTSTFTPTNTVTTTATAIQTATTTKTATATATPSCIPATVVTAVPTPSCTATPIPSCTFTATPTGTVIPTTTVTPTPTRSQVDITSFNPGGPFIDLPCSAQTISVDLGGSFIPTSGTTIMWTSTCTGASFSDTSSFTPTLSFSAIDGSQLPSVCQVSATVSDGSATKTTVSDVSVGVCPKDCTNTFFGTVKADNCGICGGDGSECVACDTRSIAGVQQVLDTRAAALRTNALRLATRLTATARSKTEKSKLAKDAKKAKAAADAYYKLAWQTVYTEFPATIMSCPSEKLCVSVSTVTSKTVYLDNIKKLETLIRSLAKKVAKDRALQTTVNKILKTVTKDLKTSRTAISEIPNTNSACTQGSSSQFR